MSLQALEKRIDNLERHAGNHEPHTHPLKLYLLGGDSEPDAAWLAKRAVCAGCAWPHVTKPAVWPDEAWHAL